MLQCSAPVVSTTLSAAMAGCTACSCPPGATIMLPALPRFTNTCSGLPCSCRCCWPEPPSGCCCCCCADSWEAFCCRAAAAAAACASASACCPVSLCSSVSFGLMVVRCCSRASDSGASTPPASNSTGTPAAAASCATCVLTASGISLWSSTAPALAINCRADMQSSWWV